LPYVVNNTTRLVITKIGTHSLGCSASYAKSNIIYYTITLNREQSALLYMRLVIVLRMYVDL